MRRIAILAVLLAVSAKPSAAQAMGSCPTQHAPVDVSARLLIDGKHAASQPYRVQLMSNAGATIMETVSDGRGEARFSAVRPCSYRIRVTGIGIDEATAEVNLFPGQGSAMVFLTIVPKADGNPVPSSIEGTISSKALKIPGRAQKRYEQGLALMQKEKWREAEEKFKQASEEYADFAASWDMLGVIAMKTGRIDEGRSLFARAVQADEMYWPALLNLAKLHVAAKDLVGAEKALVKALSLNSRSAEALFLLSYVQVSTARTDEAIETTQRLHQLPHAGYALAHFVAAEAFSQKGMAPEAVSQYSQYLKESPGGPSAQQARERIQTLSAAASR